MEFSPIRMLRLELRFVCLQTVRVNLYRRNGMVRVARTVIAFACEDIRVLERWRFLEFEEQGPQLSERVRLVLCPRRFLNGCQFLYQ